MRSIWTSSSCQILLGRRFHRDRTSWRVGRSWACPDCRPWERLGCEKEPFRCRTGCDGANGRMGPCRASSSNHGFPSWTWADTWPDSFVDSTWAADEPLSRGKSNWPSECSSTNLKLKNQSQMVKEWLVVNFWSRQTSSSYFLKGAWGNGNWSKGCWAWLKSEIKAYITYPLSGLKTAWPLTYCSHFDWDMGLHWAFVEAAASWNCRYLGKTIQRDQMQIVRLVIDHLKLLNDRLQGPKSTKMRRKLADDRSKVSAKIECLE